MENDGFRTNVLKCISKFLQAGTGYSVIMSNGRVEMKALGMRYNTQWVSGLIIALDHTLYPHHIV
jgi:hypothetical protein